MWINIKSIYLPPYSRDNEITMNNNIKFQLQSTKKFNIQYNIQPFKI